jgi:hypothetical protein
MYDTTEVQVRRGAERHAATDLMRAFQQVNDQAWYQVQDQVYYHVWYQFLRQSKDQFGDHIRVQIVNQTRNELKNV